MNGFQAVSLTEKDLIEAVVSNSFIVDYGYINKVNPDGTVDVTHAARPVLLDGTELAETVTEGVEVLTVSGAGFSVRWDYKAGDRVLIIGLKDYVPHVADVSKSEVPAAFFHYSRSTVKAIPLCLFNEDAKARVIAENGRLSLSAEDAIELNGSDLGGLADVPELRKQLGFLTQRLDTVISALQNAPTAALDGGAAYKAGISAVLAGIVNKEDFSGIENKKVLHGTGG